mmetsp:Transcript_35046/g.64904  ORF Transcript_35046/g.64904 Transcript_35046/m.64904 type:complete len:157 (-) Transcript_35046:1135-1605(-)
MAASARPWVEPRRRGRGRNRRTMHIDEPEQERELNLEGFTTGDANALLRSNPDLVQYCRRLWGCKKERWPPACHWPLLLGRILEACVTNKVYQKKKGKKCSLRTNEYAFSVVCVCVRVCVLAVYPLALASLCSRVRWRALAHRPCDEKSREGAKIT